MRDQLSLELKVGIFVTIGVGLMMAAILVLGSTENLTSRKTRYRIHFHSVDGMVTGAKVSVGGVQVGTVETIAFDAKRRDIAVGIAVVKDASQWVRQDSTAEIATQGVLGDKFITVTSGSPETPALAENADIIPVTGKDLSQFLSKGDTLMVSLNSIAGSLDRLLKSFEKNGRNEIFFQSLATASKNLSSASEKLNAELENIHIKSAVNNLDGILGKINNGAGTLGALVNDPGLYDDAKALLGGANRNRIVRNIVRKTIRDNEKPEAAEQEKKQ